MNDIIKAIAKLLPFEAWGLKREIAEPLSIILLTAAALLAGWFVKDLFKRIKARREAIAATLPQFDWVSIKKATRYFIPTQYQNPSPSRQDEPGFTHAFIAKNKLIPFFIKTAFNQKIQAERFYLVLGDSGMGKTTFLINLYLHYHRLFNRHRQLKMRILRLSDANTLKTVAGIPPDIARDTILLLDALDEDSLIYPEAPSISPEKAFRDRLDTLITATSSFAIVVMTCRSQYFPGQEDDPFELKLRRADENGFYLLNKLYISPFTIEEVRRFLRKRFGWLPFHTPKRRRAERIVEQATNLVMRPMLLNYIDYLLDEPSNLHSTLTIYDALVRNWLKREAAKRKSKGEQQAFIDNLDALSSHLAVDIYRKWRSEQRLWLSREETMQLANRFNILLDPNEITGQSLLTCDGFGNWKFAHRSIMEYYLAIELNRRPAFLKEFAFDAQSMTWKFYVQMGDAFFYVNSTTPGNSTPFYVKHKLIYAPEYSSFWHTVDKTTRYTLFKLEDAKNYCDQLNEQSGYPPIYANPAVGNNNPLPRGYQLPSIEQATQIYTAFGPPFNSHEAKFIPPPGLDVSKGYWCLRKHKPYTFAIMNNADRPKMGFQINPFALSHPAEDYDKYAGLQLVFFP